VWALARLGTTRTCLPKIARSGVFVERHLASWERCVSGAQGDLRAVSQQRVTQLLPQLGASLGRWDALLAAVDPTVSPQVRGQMPGVQTGHDHRGNPARGASLGGHHWALVGRVASWGTGDLCGPVLARLLPGQLKPLTVCHAWTVGGSSSPWSESGRRGSESGRCGWWRTPTLARPPA